MSTFAQKCSFKYLVSDVIPTRHRAPQHLYDTAAYRKA